MPGGGIGTYFLKLDGIAGESSDDKHKEEIELVSFSWGVNVARSSTGAASGRASGKAQIKQFEFVMRVNKASPALFLAVVSGKHLKEASLTVGRGAKAAYEWLKIKFSDVLITSWEQTGDAEAPHELVAFDFARVELEVTPQTARGAAGTAAKAGWDLKKNLKI
jgi:type VI secretion system secreted protein Hcp